MNDSNDLRELLDSNLRSLDIEIGAGRNRKAKLILRYCAGGLLMLKDVEGAHDVIYLSSGEAHLLVRWLTFLLTILETPAPRIAPRPRSLADILPPPHARKEQPQ